MRFTINKHSILYIISLLAFVSGVLAALPFSVGYAQQWIHTRQDGDWNDPATWQGGVVPGPTDNVRIQRDVTLSGDVTVNDFRILQPGTITPTGTTPMTLTVNGLFDVKNGFYHNDLINVYLSGPGTNQSLDCDDFFGLTIDGSYQIESNTVISGLLRVTPNGSLVDNAAYVIDLTKADTAFINEGSVVLSSTVRYSGTDDQYVTGATYGNLEMTGTGTTKTAIGDITVDNTMLVDAGTAFDARSSTITLNGTGTPFTLNGTFDYGTSTVNYAASGNQYITESPYYNLQATGTGIKYLAGSPTIYGDLTFSAQLEAGSDTLHIQGSYLSVSGGFITGTLFSVRFFGTGNSRMVTTNQMQQDVTHLIIQKASYSDTVRVEAAASGFDAAIKTNATGNLDVFSGVLDLGTAYILRVSGTIQTGHFILSDGTTIRVAHPDGMPYFSTAGGSGPITHSSYTIGPRSTWELYGDNQTVRGGSQGISSYGNLVLKGTGTKTQGGAVNIVTSLVRTSPTYYSLGGNSLVYVTGAALWYLLSDSTGMGFQTPQITADDEWPVSNGPTDVVIANAMNVSLHANRTMTGNLMLVDGKVILGATNLTISNTAAILYATDTRYIVTNSTGFLVKTDLSSTPFFFPIGPDVTAYDPVTLANNGVTDTYYARVQSWITYSPFDATRVVNRQWTLDEAVAGGSNLDASFRWDHTEQASNFDPHSTVLLLRSVAGAWGESFSTAVSGSGFFVADVTGILDLTDFILSNDAFLPVELTAFTATESKRRVTLRWSTASELNNAGFEIQRRTRNSAWIPVTFVPGYGTTAEPRNYIYMDDLSVLPVVDEYYEYRLRQIDIDGATKDSKTLAIELAGIVSTYCTIFPNPCRYDSQLQVTLLVPGTVSAEIFDASGVRRSTVIQAAYMNAGTYFYRMVLGELHPGMYFCRITSPSGMRTVMFRIAG